MSSIGTMIEPTSQVMLLELIHMTHLGLYLTLVCHVRRQKERKGGCKGERGNPEK